MAKRIDFKAAFEKQREQQRAAGVDIAAPMNNLITTEPEPKTEAEKLAGFVPEAAGKRTKRVQLVMTPELYDRTKAAANKAGISFNEFINQLCNFITQ